MSDTALNIELETTVPTDLTISSYNDHAVKKASHADSKRFDKHPVDRKEIIRLNELLKYDLSRKTSKIENLQRELNAKTQEFEEKLSNCLNKKKIIQTKAKAEIDLFQEESNRKIALIQRDLADAKRRAEQSEDLLQKLRHSVDFFSFCDEDYSRLKSKPLESLNIVDYIVLKTHELLWQYKRQNEELKSRYSKLEKTNIQLQEELNKHIERHQNIQLINNTLEHRIADVSAKLNTTKSKIDRGNYANENFPRVKNERDVLQEKLLETIKSMDDMKAELLEAHQAKSSIQAEVLSWKHKYDLLLQECSSVSRQLSEMMQKLGESQDECLKLKSELKLQQKSKEELWQRFGSFREKVKSEYEEHLLQERNKAEFTAVMQYEEKIRILKESEISLSQQKESVERALSELKKKYEELYVRSSEKSFDDSQQIKQLHQDLENLKVEKQKILVKHTVLQQTHKEKCLECDKALTRLQLIEEEIEHLRNSSNEQLRSLETELGTNRAKLEMFEKMEGELEDVVLEMAKNENITNEAAELIADDMLLPKKARQCFLKCLNLMKKVLQLEQLLHSQEGKLRAEKEKNEKLQEELSSLNSLLDQLDQPYAFFTLKLRESEAVVRDLREKLKQSDIEIKALQEENKCANEKLITLSEDCNKIKQNQEEIKAMKKQLAFLQTQCHPDKINVTDKKSVKKKTATRQKWK